MEININPIYFTILNIFISIAILLDISDKKDKRLLFLFILKYLLTILNSHFIVKTKQNEEILKCNEIFFYITLWLLFGLLNKLNYLYYISSTPFVIILFYNYISENKNSQQFSDYSIFLYFLIWYILRNKEKLIYFKG